MAENTEAIIKLSNSVAAMYFAVRRINMARTLNIPDNEENEREIDANLKVAFDELRGAINALAEAQK